MAITKYYTTLYYYPKTNTDNGVGTVTSYLFANRVSFDGLINQASGTPIIIDGVVAKKVQYKMYCAVTVVFPEDCIIYDGTYAYKIATDELIPKNTVGRNHHLKLRLETTSIENIELGAEIGV